MHNFIDIMLSIFGIVIIFFFSLLIVIKINNRKKGKIIEIICFLDNKGTHSNGDDINILKPLIFDKNIATAYFNRGLDYFNQGNYYQAIADYDQALKLNSQYSDAYNNRGVAYYKLGRNFEAIESYKLFMRYAPSTDPNIEKAKKRIRDLGGTI